MTDIAHENIDHDLSFIAETRTQVQQLFDAFQAGRVQVSPELVTALSQIREQLMAIKLDGSIEPDAANQRIAACVQIVKMLPKPATVPTIPAPPARPTPTVSPALTTPGATSTGPGVRDQLQTVPFEETGSQEHLPPIHQNQVGHINPGWGEPDTASWPPPDPFPFAGPTPPPGRDRFPRWPTRLAAGLVAVSLVGAGAWKLERKQAKNLITPQVEAEVYSSTWMPFVDAMNGGGLAMMKQVATPSTVHAMIGYMSCGCAWSASPQTYNFAAPTEAKYPLYLYSEMQDTTTTRGDPIVLEVEFTKSTARSPWLVANAGEYSGDSMLSTNTSGGNWSSTAKVPIPVQQGPADLNNYFQQIDSTGDIPPLPPHWRANPFLESIATDAATGYRLNESEGLSQKVTHTIIEESPPIGLGKGAVTFATQAIQDTITSNGSHLINQPSDQSTFGPLVAPGSYRKMTFETTNDICIYESPQGIFEMVTNLGGNYAAQVVNATSPAA